MDNSNTNNNRNNNNNKMAKRRNSSGERRSLLVQMKRLSSLRHMSASNLFSHIMQQPENSMALRVRNRLQTTCTTLDQSIQVHSDKAMARLQNDNTLGATLSMKKLRELQQQHEASQRAYQQVTDYIQQKANNENDFLASVLHPSRELEQEDVETVVERILRHFTVMLKLEEPQVALTPAVPARRNSISDDTDKTDNSDSYKGSNLIRQRRRLSLERDFQQLSGRSLVARSA
mmetsp:Transcript_14322/g.32524  ORF Transcript_14322/g.32524 Transcript_14322/m.32524 type:complete len:232 (+) Transcript_14322:118-813(+)